MRCGAVDIALLGQHSSLHERRMPGATMRKGVQIESIERIINKTIELHKCAAGELLEALQMND